MTQAQEILKALQCGRRLTPLDALNDFGCFRLGARIHELKGMGYPIDSRFVAVGNGKQVKQYWIEN